MTYAEFLASKKTVVQQTGIEPHNTNPALFDFQRTATEYALRLGRAALFLDTGLGKSFCQLEWANQLPVNTLILTPLAVAEQTKREGERFGIEAGISRDGKRKGKITIVNYERAHLFDLSEFGAVVLDESSILKNFMGKTKRWLCAAFAGYRFRLACTATPAPNDYMELGNHSDFLSHMDSCEMLQRFFINDTMSFGSYRLKKYAEPDFWRWVGSWAVCAEKPSDLGGDDTRYKLPSLEITTHTIAVDPSIGREEGYLLRHAELSATTMHRDKRLTLKERCEKAAECATRNPDPCIIWCESNDESALLSELIPDAVEVVGSQSVDEKEEKLTAFSTGKVPRIITKSSIAGFGMNWQHCAHQVVASVNYSYESFYQAVRRSWRFGQTKPVKVEAIIAETEWQIWRTILEKQMRHDAMKVAMTHAKLNQTERRDTKQYEPNHIGRLPEWLVSRE